jgi:hypothetical protein
MKQPIPIHITRTKPSKPKRDQSVDKILKTNTEPERKEMSTQTESIEEQ